MDNEKKRSVPHWRNELEQAIRDKSLNLPKYRITKSNHWLIVYLYKTYNTFRKAIAITGNFLKRIFSFCSKWIKVEQVAHATLITLCRGWTFYGWNLCTRMDPTTATMLPMITIIVSSFVCRCICAFHRQIVHVTQKWHTENNIVTFALNWLRDE